MTSGMPHIVHCNNDAGRISPLWARGSGLSSADYLETIRDRPVLPPMSPGQLTASLPAQAPEFAESIDRIVPR